MFAPPHYRYVATVSLASMFCLTAVIFDQMTVARRGIVHLFVALGLSLLAIALTCMSMHHAGRRVKVVLFVLGIIDVLVIADSAIRIAGVVSR